MPNLSYMAVNFFYLAGMSAWVGGSFAALAVRRPEAPTPETGRLLTRLHHLQAVAAVPVGASSVVKALVWESPAGAFPIRYGFLAAMGLLALYGLWKVAPALTLEARRPEAVAASRRIQTLTLLLGLAALLLS